MFTSSTQADSVSAYITSFARTKPPSGVLDNGDGGASVDPDGVGSGSDTAASRDVLVLVSAGAGVGGNSACLSDSPAFVSQLFKRLMVGDKSLLGRASGSHCEEGLAVSNVLSGDDSALGVSLDGSAAVVAAVEDVGATMHVVDRESGRGNGNGSKSSEGDGELHFGVWVALLTR
jgi:hypothetical protein